MKKLLKRLNKLFPTITVNIFCNDDRLVIEIDKTEIFYYNHLTEEFKYKYIRKDKAELIKNLYMMNLFGGDIDG